MFVTPFLFFIVFNCFAYCAQVSTSGATTSCPAPTFGSLAWTRFPHSAEQEKLVADLVRSKGRAFQNRFWISLHSFSERCAACMGDSPRWSRP